MEKYIPQTLRHMRRYDFLNLEQGKMYVAIYETKFRALLRYVTHLCLNVQERNCRNVKGLRSDFQIPSLQVAAAANPFRKWLIL